MAHAAGDDFAIAIEHETAVMGHGGFVTTDATGSFHHLVINTCNNIDIGKRLYVNLYILGGCAWVAFRRLACPQRSICWLC